MKFPSKYHKIFKNIIPSIKCFNFLPTHTLYVTFYNVHRYYNYIIILNTLGLSIILKRSPLQ